MSILFLPFGCSGFKDEDNRTPTYPGGIAD